MVVDRTGETIVAGDDLLLCGEIVAFDGSTAIVRCGERTFRVHAADGLRADRAVEHIVIARGFGGAGATTLDLTLAGAALPLSTWGLSCGRKRTLVRYVVTAQSAEAGGDDWTLTWKKNGSAAATGNVAWNATAFLQTVTVGAPSAAVTIDPATNEIWQLECAGPSRDTPIVTVEMIWRDVA